MTTASTTARPTSAAPWPDDLTGVTTLTRFMLRRDRVRLPAWAAGFGAFVVYLAVALPTAYVTTDDLDSIMAMFRDPVGRMLTGPGYGLDDPTYARLIANGYGLYFLLLAGLMNILLVVRHTRAEEQSGRAELVGANVVGRYAALTAALVVALLTNGAVVVVVAVTMVAVGGFGIGGSLLFGASIAAFGLAIAGLTALTAQLSEGSRAAAGLAGAALGAAFVLRAVGDMARSGGNALSWLSPLGWSQQTAPFVLDRWWPLALPLALAVVTTVAAYAQSTRRDLGASRFAVHAGPARATASLGTPLGLAWRLQRPAIVWWTVALAVSGVVFGAFADSLLDAVGDMPDVFIEVFGAEDLLAGYLAYMAVFMAYLASTFAVLAIQAMRNDETSGRGEALLATPIGRRGWLVSNLAVTTAGVVVIMAVTGLATGIGATVATGDAAHVGELTLAHLNQIPAVLVVLGVAALLFGTRPRAIPATWALVAYGVLVGTFGRLLDLPGLALDISPFEHLARMPLVAVELLPVVVLIALAAATTALASLTFRRRDITVS